jgi:dipeptidyl aminopeptidase/acylaminoacyl peptidase
VPLDVFRGGNSFSWSPDSRTLYYIGGHSVWDYLVRQDLTTGRMERVTDRVASAPSFTTDMARAVFLKASPSLPTEIRLLEGSAESSLTNVGDSVAAYPRVQPKVVTWKSRDGLPIEGVLFLPFTYQPGERVPLLVELHGGPTGVILDSFPVPRTYA